MINFFVFFFVVHNNENVNNIDDNENNNSNSNKIIRKNYNTLLGIFCFYHFLYNLSTVVFSDLKRIITFSDFQILAYSIQYFPTKVFKK